MKCVFRRGLYENWCDRLGVIITGFNDPNHWSHLADGMEVDTDNWITVEEPHYILRAEWCESDTIPDIPYDLGQMIFVKDDHFEGYGMVSGKNKYPQSNCPQVMYRPVVDGKVAFYERETHPNNCRIANFIFMS